MGSNNGREEKEVYRRRHSEAWMGFRDPYMG